MWMQPTDFRASLAQKCAGVQAGASTPGPSLPAVCVGFYALLCLLTSATRGCSHVRAHNEAFY